MDQFILETSAIVPESDVAQKASASFIEANTIEASFDEIQENHIIPVFVKDNETAISHGEFIETTMEAACQFYSGETILKPAIRLSHPIKGRIPEARNKKAHELEEHEKTLYYERMAFVIEIPSISRHIQGNLLNLCIGGVKAYNLDNMYNKKGVDEHFKFFVGFQNKVCTNLCIWTDGFSGDVKVKSLKQLREAILYTLQVYSAEEHLTLMSNMGGYTLSENQFAQLIGRCRMYQHLPVGMKNEIPALGLGDSQVGAVVRDYYRDNSFCRDSNGTINLWNLYNLFTGSAKSSYIDNFLDRSASTFEFTQQLARALDGGKYNWYLS
jgi:Domain of unknown function, B. Theta Gene description (DUF3871)